MLLLILVNILLLEFIKLFRVYKAVKGLGTDNKLLIRILVTRDEIDMPQIKNAYKRLYGKDMVQAVKDDTSGDYKKLLVELCSH